jgi:hypothetical protein
MFALSQSSTNFQVTRAMTPGLRVRSECPLHFEYHNSPCTRVIYIQYMHRHQPQLSEEGLFLNHAYVSFIKRDNCVRESLRYAGRRLPPATYPSFCITIQRTASFAMARTKQTARPPTGRPARTPLSPRRL